MTDKSHLSASNTVFDACKEFSGVLMYGHCSSSANLAPIFRIASIFCSYSASISPSSWPTLPDDYDHGQELRRRRRCLHEDFREEFEDEEESLLLDVQPCDINTLYKFYLVHIENGFKYSGTFLVTHLFLCEKYSQSININKNHN